MNSELALPENLDDAQLRCWLIDKIETLIHSSVQSKRNCSVPIEVK